MTFTRGTQVQLSANPRQHGVVCRFIGDNPVVAWVGDNLITMHEADELTPRAAPTYPDETSAT